MTGWFSVVPEALLAGALLLLPGLPAVLLLGLRGFTALATAPLVSVTLVAVVGEACGLAGVPWGLLPLLVGVVLAATIAWAAGRFLPAPAGSPSRRNDLTSVLATALGSALVLSATVPGMRSPHRYAQAFDTSFHVNLIRWMTQHHDVAATHAQSIVDPGGGFYPAAFHAIAATMELVTGSDPVVVGNVLALVVTAGLWIAGCVLLVRQVVGPDRAALVLAGVTSAMFSAFPYYFLGYGVLWPNALGNALLPAALACLLAVVGPTIDDVIGSWRGALLLLVALPGIGVAHPNAFITLVVVAYLLVVLRFAPRFVDSVRRREARPALALLGFAVAVPAAGLLATRVVPPLRAASNFDWAAREELPQALGEAALFATGRSGAQWAAAVVVIIGIAVVSRRRGPWWPIAVLVVFGLLFAVAAGVDSRVSQLLTGPWYNDAGRLAAVMVLGAVPLATVGLRAVVGRGVRPRLPLWASTLAVLLLVLVVTGGLYRRDHVTELLAYHRSSGSQVYATSVQQKALRNLGEQLPAGAVVASNPWNGSQLLYALTGRTVLFAHFKPALTPARTLVAEHADDVASDPQVCEAMRATGVTHVLTYARRITYWSWSPRTKQYPGLDDVAGQPGYQLVDRSGPYSLWKLTAC
ncbi:MAG TPA: DUF6541 family protein [Actinomycetales bacterium]|nr:DUF6541 family protein [Actinomycetales bacterium]